jgi:hypothetical protein
MYCLLIFFLGLNSCQRNQESTQEILEQIAKDKAYVDYQKIKNDLAVSIASNEFDLEGLHYVLDKYSNLKFCNIPTSVVEPFKGGKEYLTLNCKLDKSVELFYKKYPIYEKLSTEERKKIRLISIENGYLPSNGSISKTILNNKKTN